MNVASFETIATIGVNMAHRQFGNRQFSQFEIQAVQPKVYRQFKQRFQPVLQKAR